MKIKFTLIIFLLVIISCNTSENSKQIYYYKNNEYKIKISTIENKVNAEGKAQCSKYRLTTRNDFLFISYGFRLKNLIAESYKTNPKYLNELPFDSLNNKYFDVKIENYTNSVLNYDSILLINICKIFKIEISNVDSIINGYELEIQDSLKLSSYKVLCKGGVKYSDGIWSDGIWVASSINLYELAKILDEYSKLSIDFDKLMEDYYSIKNCYSIDFYTGNDIDKINTKLFHYGLKLNNKAINKTFYKIKTLVDNESGK